MPALDNVLQRLREHQCPPKQSGSGWASKCPAHEDSTPSLSIRPRDDGRGVVVKCHAGCGVREVLGAIGLRLPDLYDEGGGPTPARQASRPPTRDWGKLAAGFRNGMPPGQLEQLARVLGVTPAALAQLGVGWATSEQLAGLIGKRVKGPGWTFPMYDAGGRVLGINVRGEDGHKWTISGGSLGLFIPADLVSLPDPVLVVEGASDVAAAICHGLAAVGRPSNKAGVAIVAELLVRRAAVIVGENDRKGGDDGTEAKWPGREGAIAVAQQLAARWRRSVPWILPPAEFKDLRAWHRSGRPIAPPAGGWGATR